MPPTRLIYASSRTDRSAAALDQIFEVSRDNNRRDGITGALIVSDDVFVQLLEGDRRLVSECMWRIVQDVRHTDIELVGVNQVPHRLFAEWSLHRIETSGLGQKLLKPYLTNGVFQPKQMRQAALEDLCRLLSSRDPRSAP